MFDPFVPAWVIQYLGHFFLDQVGHTRTQVDVYCKLGWLWLDSFYERSILSNKAIANMKGMVTMNLLTNIFLL